MSNKFDLCYSEQFSIIVFLCYLQQSLYPFSKIISYNQSQVSISLGMMREISRNQANEESQKIILHMSSRLTSYQQISCLFITRIVQNMSSFDLNINTVHRMPDYPNLAQTLLFIETHRFCPMSSTVSLGRNMPKDLEEPEDMELSLELKLQNANHQTINSASMIKKKKGGCTCKKTKCLKMYCECFSSGRMCTSECACSGCSNCEGHGEMIAKAKQIIQIKTGSLSKVNGLKGCTCKKSQCRKKYCECFNAGVACGEDCKCQDCRNGQCDRHQKQKKERETIEVKPSAGLLLSLVSF